MRLKNVFNGIISPRVSGISALAAVLALSLNTAPAFADARTQAKRIHDRVAGVAPSNAVLDSMETLIQEGKGTEAAYIAMDNPAFYNVTLKNLITPWTNEEQTVFKPLNDYTTTVIGVVLDERDFREILFGNYIYVGKLPGLPAYAGNPTSNAHYEALEEQGVVKWNATGDGVESNIEMALQSDRLGIDEAGTAGIMTTRAAARAFFIDGTNRAMFRFTLLNHLCTDLEQIKDNTRPPDMVRRDVARSPGGDSRIFMNACVGCHAGMDALGGALASYNYVYNGDMEGGALEYTAGVVQPKYLINSNNFKAGYRPTDDRWFNYWRNGQNALLGWRDYPGIQIDDRNHSYGMGAKTMGMELAYSSAFSQCQVKKVFKQVCLRDPDDYAADRSQVSQFVNNFESSGYKLKTVFADVANYCKGD